MSVRHAKAVLESDLQPGLRLVAVVMALYADKDGSRIFPAVQTVADEAGVTERSARRAISRLRDLGVLVAESDLHGGTRNGKGRAVRYWMDVGALPARQPNPDISVPLNPDTSVRVENPISDPATRTSETPTRTLATPTRTPASAYPDTSVRGSVMDPPFDPPSDPPRAPFGAPRSRAGCSSETEDNGGTTTTTKGASMDERPETAPTIGAISGPEALSKIMAGVAETNPVLAEAWKRDRERRRRTA